MFTMFCIFQQDFIGQFDNIENVLSCVYDLVLHKNQKTLSRKLEMH